MTQSKSLEANLPELKQLTDVLVCSGAEEERAGVFRILTSILEDIIDFQGNLAVIRYTSNKIHVSLQRESLSFKSYELSERWWRHMLWLLRLHSLSSSSKSNFGGGLSFCQFPVQKFSVGFESDLKVGGDEATLTLKAFQIETKTEYLIKNGLLDPELHQYQDLLKLNAGIVVISGPNISSIKAGLGTLLSLANFNILGELGHVTKLPKDASSLPFLVTDVAPDPLITLTKLRQASDFKRQVVGVFGIGVFKELCNSCKTPLVLPPAFAKLSLYTANNKDCVKCAGRAAKSISMSRMLRVSKEILDTLDVKAVLKNLSSISFFKVLHKHKLLGNYDTKDLLTPLFADDAPSFWAEELLPFATPHKGMAVQTVGQVLDFSKADTSIVEVPDSVKPQAETKSETLVLVVEDDPDQRDILEIVLAAAGYRIKSVANGLEALSYLKYETPALILTDIMMPGLDGVELVTTLKSSERFCHIPIMVLTVLGDNETETALRELGVSDYCAKNIQRKNLISRIESLIGSETTLNP